MSVDELIEELNIIIHKVKMKMIFYQTENKELRKRITELKKIVKDT